MDFKIIATFLKEKEMESIVKMFSDAQIRYQIDSSMLPENKVKMSIHIRKIRLLVNVEDWEQAFRIMNNYYASLVPPRKAFASFRPGQNRQEKGILWIHLFYGLVFILAISGIIVLCINAFYYLGNIFPGLIKR